MTERKARATARTRARLWELINARRLAVRDRCVSLVVDDVRDLAQVVECDGHLMVEANAGLDGDLDGTGELHVGMAEDGVDAEAPGFVRGYAVRHFVRGPAVDAGG